MEGGARTITSWTAGLYTGGRPLFSLFFCRKDRYKMEKGREEKTGALGPHLDEEAWLKERKNYLGASEVAAILGVEGAPMTELDVYLDKTGATEGKKETKYMRRGKVMEEPAAELYAEETGRKIRRIPMRVHPTLPIAATLDRQVLAGEDNPTAGLEIKVPAWRTFSKVLRDGILPHWIIQGSVQQMVTGYPFIAFGILNADAWEMVTHDFYPIPGLAPQIEDKVGKWWETHIVGGVAPIPKITPPLELPEVDANTKIVKVDDERWAKAASMLMAAREVLEDAQELDKLARDTMKEYMRDKDLNAAEGAGIRAYLKTQAGRKTFQPKELMAVKPLDRNAVIDALVQIHSWSLSEAQDLADQATLSFGPFWKVGRDFETFKPYFLKEGRNE
jgi:predicted phage-related endonuclease